MSKIKVYPWPNVAPEYFGQNAINPSGNPTSETTQLSTSICEALLTGELTPRDSDGNPAPKGFTQDSVTSLYGKYRYVYPSDVNDWLSNRGYLKKWTPSSTVDEHWKAKAMEYANDIWLREISRSNKPTKDAIAGEIEGRLSRERIVSTKNKVLTREYIRRHALSDWDPPILD